MTLMDYTLDGPEQQSSVDVKHSSRGYRVQEVKPDGSLSYVARIAAVATCLGLIAAGGMVWTLADANFPGDPILSKVMLSSVLFIVASAFVFSGALSGKSGEVQVDLKGRVLHVVCHGITGFKRSRTTFRFEEITRIDLEGSNLMTDLRSVLTRWDYGRINLRAHGDHRVKLFGGDMMELEPLLRRLRADTGVA
ncbi:MAG: hypothetical protein ABJN34_10615 [Litoreibacter sp.]|uniref:hypothetical protein n=1 Tax=Litoreibacter sp. TaxID=1969459 RepID=UPI003296F615